MTGPIAFDIPETEMPLLTEKPIREFQLSGKKVLSYYDLTQVFAK